MLNGNDNLSAPQLLDKLIAEQKREQAEIQQSIIEAIDSKPIIAMLLRSTGYYDMAMKHLPIILKCLLNDKEGREVLKEIGLEKYVK